jgi:hypothetical protein
METQRKAKEAKKSTNDWICNELDIFLF